MSFYKIIRPVIFALPEEFAHDFALKLLKSGLIPKAPKPNYPKEILSSEIFDLHFKNPVGLAAGLDKNAVAIDNLISQGFGFAEVGTVTPMPQSGNPKPRLFRLKEDEAIINRMGFNNNGIEKFRLNLLNRKKTDGIIGANIGKNKDSANNADDYIISLRKIYGLSDYITINISSPNTPNLREIQKSDILDNFLSEIKSEHEKLSNEHDKKIPLLLKIAPDIDHATMENIAELSIKHQIDGLIISNTTIVHDNLKSKKAGEQGGLSGKPLFDKSTNLLREIYKLTGSRIHLIGVGGIFSGDDAYQKILAGASLVQIYTSLIYEGFGLVDRINARLAFLLARDGFKNISEAVGKGG